MLDLINQLSDCYIALAALKIAKNDSKGSQAHLVAPDNDSCSAFDSDFTDTKTAIAHRVLKRMKLDTSIELPHEALRIYELGKYAETPLANLPAWTTDLFQYASDGWGITDSKLRELLDAALLVPILIMLKTNLPHGQSPALSDDTPAPLIQFLVRLGVFKEENDEWVATEKGQYFIDKAMIGALAVSYAPMLLQLCDPTNSHTWSQSPTGIAESHVDRRLNVLSSGHQHKRFFDDLIRTATDAINSQPEHNIPRMIADMGCGDGSLLKQFLQAIAAEKPIEQVPQLIAADLNRAALSATKENLHELDHLRIEADIRNPGAFLAQIAASLNPSTLNSNSQNADPGHESLRDQILHVRTFLDHDRTYDEPQDTQEAESWRGIHLTGHYLRRNGEQLPPHYAFQALVEHFRRWRKIIGRHGMLLLEVHAKRPVLSSLEDHNTNSIHFEAIHAWSGQQLIEADNFVLAAAAAGLFTDHKCLKRYPQHSDFTQISLHWLHKKPFAIRMGQKSDLPSIMQLKKACWGDLALDIDEVRTRILARPSGMFLVTDLDSGEIVGALSTQRIRSADLLMSSAASNLSSLADPQGRVLQLLSINVPPDKQEQGIGDLLLQFIQSYATLSDEIDEIVGVTRCRSANTNDLAEYLKYIRQRDEWDRPVDPILRFHHEHGATVGEVVPKFRPKDRENHGCGILIRYPVRRKSVVANPTSLPTDCGSASRNTIAPPDFVAGEIDAEIRRLLSARNRTIFDPERPLVELGLDSLDIQELRLILSKRTGLEFNSEFFFNYPTASKIHTAIAAKANHQTDAVSNIDHESQSSSRTFANPPLADAIESASANSQFQIDSPTQIQSTTAINGNGIPSQEPIAIIGMACRFPGHVNNPTDYWSLLCSGRSGVVTVPKERWDADRLHHPDPDTPGKMWTRQGGFLHGIDQFDAPFFGISRREARKLDPQQRLLLETAWHTFEDAGLQPARIAGSKTGVFVGIGFNDYAGYVFSDHNSIDAYCATGTFQSTASGRLSYFYDLCGPCMSVDTACSSSITALHLAVNSLRQGESEMALVAGANFISPEVSINFTKARMLSPDGVCRTFDKSANGYVRGEGCGAVLLKRLTDAERDGDIIHAVIRATACNQDGRSNGLTAPNGLAQQTLLREMLATAQVPPESIAYAEAHGTATPLGDPLEANALITALRRESTAPNTPLLVGSVKTNLGHLEAAAGMASLIKVVLTLGNHKIPPHLNFEDWNPEILRSDVDVQVPLAVTEFPPFSTPARATVSSFGFGGTNAMALVEEYPATSRFSPIASDEMTTDERAPHESESTPQILCLSAKSSSSLKRSIQAWLNFLPNTPAPLGDLALATQISRQHFQYRRAIVASSIEAAIDALMEIQIDDDTATELPNSQIGPQIAFLFTGQGSQYWNMGRALYRSQPSFRASFQECSDGFERLLPESLQDVLFSNDSSDRRIHDTLYTQPALFALEVSLARMWLGFGVQPSVCLGHSIGEFAAALTAGVLDLPDAIAIVAERARLMNSLPRLGGMTACFAEEKTVVASLQSYAGRLAIAAANSPNNTVVSGESESLSQFENDMRNRGVTCQRLTVSHAFHSPLMQPIAKEFAAFCSKFTFHKAKIPFVSNVTGKLFDDGHRFDADYLVRQLLGTVRFADCVKTASEFGTRIFLELGPDATLSSLGKRTVSGSKTEWYPSLKPKQKLEPLQQSLAGLYEKGVNIDWTKVHQGRPRPRVSIPLYEFDRQSYWYTNDQPTLTGNPTTAKQTPCLPNGSTAIDIQSTPDGDLHWRMELRGSSDADGLVKSLIEHRIRERSLFPAAGYVAISMLAAEHLLPSVKQHIDTHRVDLERGYRWRLMECKLLKPLALDSQRPVTLHCSMRRINQEEPAASSVRWQLATYFRHTDAPQGSWNQSFSGCLELKISNNLPLEGASAARGGLHQDQLAGIDDFQADDTIQIGADFYAGLRESGYHYGEPYQLVDRIALRDGTSRYDLKQLPSPDEFEKSLASRLGRTTVWLDCLAHGTLAIRPDSDIDSLWLPVGWDQFEWYVMDEGTPSDRSDGLWSCQAETESEEGDSYRCGLQAVSPSKVSLRWSGLSFQRIRKEIAEKKTDLVDTSSSQTALGCVDNGKGLDEINVLMDELKPVLADVLMLDNQEDVSTEKDFSELGMDSIMAAEFEIELSCRAGEKAIASSEFTSLRNLRQVAERLHHNGLRSLSKEGA